MNEMDSFWEQHPNLQIFGSALLVLVLCWAAGSILSRAVFPRILKKLDGKRLKALELLIRGFRRPLNVYLKIAGLCWALLIACHWRPAITPLLLEKVLTRLPGILNAVLRVAGVLCATWGLLGSGGITGLLLGKARHRLDLHLTKSVTRFLSAIYNVVVVAVAAVILLSEFGYNINGLIAGLGLGGLTIALAAQDSAANFFGGLVLVAEKPFEIGDWIQTDGVEGTVEDINLRSTTVRTAPGALTVVPNAKLSGSAITNWSGGMDQRRAEFSLSLLYDTPREQLLAFTGAVRTMLETDPEIVTDSILVRFSDFGESALGVKVIFYTKLPGLYDHLRIRERVNLSIMQLAEAHGVSFAFPTRTLLLPEEPHPAKADAKDTADG